MKQNTYLLIVAVLFTSVSIVHLLRLVFRWQVVIDDWTVPLWPSVIAVIVAGLLAYFGFKIRDRR